MPGIGWLAPVACVLLVLTVCPAGVPGAPAVSGAEKSARSIEYAIEARVDLDAGTYSGREIVRVTNHARGKIGHLFFNLYPNVGTAPGEQGLLDVTSITIAGQVARFIEKGSGMRVELPAPLVSGASVDVTIEFEGRAARREAADVDLNSHVTDQVSIVLDATRIRPRTGSDVMTVTGDSMLLGDPFPVLAVPGDEVWSREPAAVQYTFAEPATFRIEVLTADGVGVLASGRETGRGANGARIFEGRLLRSVAMFAARSFVTDERSEEGARLRSFHSGRHDVMAKRAGETLRSAVATYARAFGPPPFTDIAVVEAPLAPGTSSVAFSGMIAVASALYTDIHGAEGRELPGFIRDVPELVEDEIEFAVLRGAARQWWAESVAWNPRRATFLVEGLSYASTSMAIAQLHGPDAVAQAVEQRLRAPYRVYRMFGGRDLPAAGQPARFPNYFVYSAIVQSKSGLFFESLRRQSGDERFHSYLREFYRGYAGTVAEPRDFLDGLKSAQNEASRKDAEQLYKRWIEQTHGDRDIGEPEYAVTVSPDVADPKAIKEDPGKRTVFERFGRFVARKMVQFGKSAAKPF